MHKQQAKISNWSIIQVYQNYSLQLAGLSLCGNVIEHSNVPDGHYVVTSLIVKSDLDNNIIETQNTIYYLIGEPHPSYKKYLELENKQLN
jgi:hypothetical protein